MKKFVLLIFTFIFITLCLFTCYKAGIKKGYRECVQDNYYTIKPK